MNVIIVENDEDTASIISRSLKIYGYTILAICSDTHQGRVKISALKPDIVIINTSLKEKNDGIELAKIIKRKHTLPFIYISENEDEKTLYDAKQTQPCGYMTKPLNLFSLHATIQIAIFNYKAINKDINSENFYDINITKLLHSKRTTDAPIVEFGGGYHIDININETFYNNNKIKLTKKENTFLRLLVAQLGHVVSFEQAMSYIWGEHEATQNTIRTLVWRLRNKLPKEIIKNASGIGYYIEE